MQKKKNIPAFLRNTYAMLEREELNQVVAWGQDGTGFVIKNLDRFSTEILPQYFKHQKYTSFVRQLNMYGFHKQRYHECPHDANYQYFAHQHFRRGDAQSKQQETKLLLAAIRRKPEKKKKLLAEATLLISQTVGENQPIPVEPVEIESYSSVRSVSMQVEEEAVVQGKKSSEQSVEEGRQEINQWGEESGQEIDEMTERMIEQNELLRSLHTIIRDEVLQSMQRSIDRLSSNNSQKIMEEENRWISRLSTLLNEGTAIANRITQTIIEIN